MGGRRDAGPSRRTRSAAAAAGASASPAGAAKAGRADLSVRLLKAAAAARQSAAAALHSCGTADMAVVEATQATLRAAAHSSGDSNAVRTAPGPAWSEAVNALATAHRNADRAAAAAEEHAVLAGRCRNNNNDNGAGAGAGGLRAQNSEEAAAK